MFFLGLLLGSTAGFFCAAMAHAASADADIRENVDQLPQLPTYLRQSSTNTGRYEIINESAANSGRRSRNGTED